MSTAVRGITGLKPGQRRLSGLVDEPGRSRGQRKAQQRLEQYE
jgi:hypothetical protein